MARYIGPKSKIARKFNAPILGPSKALKKKNYPPGQHGKSPKSKSEFASQLKEKQKAKYTYGVSEKYFKNLFRKATMQKGVTGHILLQLLERRLDTVVRRLGLAPTQASARQLVSHKHIQVNGKGVNTPSYQLQLGDIVTLKPKSKDLVVVQESLARYHKPYEWLAWDAKTFTGRFLTLPNREAIPEKIDEQTIVELYSK